MVESVDLAIVGGGAAGLATAIFAARRAAGQRIAILDGAKKLGAKILVSGGGRCNITNTVVNAEHFFGGSSHIVKRVLAAFPAGRAAAWIHELGVAMHEEEHGKLFPDSNSAHTVLNALVEEARRLNVEILTGCRVSAVRQRADGRFELDASIPVSARRVVLATGGLSLPKTGSDGFGYQLALSLGHTIVPTTPGLAPLRLDSAHFHGAISGLSLNVELEVRAAGDKPVRLVGSLLFTHFGVSGPVVLNASRVWERAKLEGRAASITANFIPGDTFETVDQRLVALAAAQPRSQLRNVLATMLAARLAEALLAALRITPTLQMAQFPREDRRRLASALVSWPLPVVASRGYDFAEVTAGGVPLTEIDPATMQSRKCPGLFLVGEILDVDGRIGGFNFQWAWSSAFVAGAAVLAEIDERKRAARPRDR